ncbi:MAG: hypothetical protein Q8K61_10540 [Gallionella sp.]|nr:hypothetical protein [Gallionella sp.]
MDAHLSLTAWDGNLVAVLESGERIESDDAYNLAEKLRLAGVTAESLTVTDWKTDLDHAPSSGEIITIKFALTPVSAHNRNLLNHVKPRETGMYCFADMPEHFGLEFKAWLCNQTLPYVSNDQGADTQAWESWMCDRLNISLQTLRSLDLIEWVFKEYEEILSKLDD